MEQILASINRIISEDKGAPGAAEPPRGVLELTEAVGEDGSVRHLTPLAMAPSGDSGRAEPQGPRAAGESAGKGEGNEPASGTGAPESTPAGIASTTTAAAASSAFAELAAAGQEKRRSGELSLGGSDRTLEAIVREVLRPLLQTWLDQNLPGLVERLVREEIARAAREAGLR